MSNSEFPFQLIHFDDSRVSLKSDITCVCSYSRDFKILIWHNFVRDITCDQAIFFLKGEGKK